MWNKLFKKRQSKQSDKSQQLVSEVRKVKQRPESTAKCFNFRATGTKTNRNDHYMLSKENFPFFQFESEIYKKPGENLSKNDNNSRKST